MSILVLCNVPSKIIIISHYYYSIIIIQQPVSRTSWYYHTKRIRISSFLHFFAHVPFSEHVQPSATKIPPPSKSTRQPYEYSYEIRQFSLQNVEIKFPCFFLNVLHSRSSVFSYFYSTYVFTSPIHCTSLYVTVKYCFKGISISIWCSIVTSEYQPLYFEWTISWRTTAWLCCKIQ